MERIPTMDEIFSKLPAEFFEAMIKDIPAAIWVRILIANPIVKKDVLEGFSHQPGKFTKALSQSLVINRLRRRLPLDTNILKEALAGWEEDHPEILAYLTMLDGDFIAAHWRQLRDLLGPARFFLGLYLLGLFKRPGIPAILDDKTFWTQEPDEAVFEILIPSLSAWGAFIEKHPELSKKFLQSDKGADFAFELDSEQTERKGKGKFDPELQERFKKIEKRLEKVLVDLNQAGDQVAHLKIENEELRRKLKESETNFERNLTQSIAARRKEWFERYQYLDRESAARETSRLESLLQRTKRALELQKRADEEYGLVSDIRAQMLEIDLSLARIASVYADSLVVHKEVEKVKDALLTEKERLLKLPGIQKLAGNIQESGRDIVTQVHLLDPVPANLPKISRFQKVIAAISELGLAGDPELLREAVRHKRKQILERLYAQYEPDKSARKVDSHFRNLEDFVASGHGKRYDLYVDGYNVILRILAGEGDLLRNNFTQLREQFIEAATAKSRYFGRVFLVFDGIEDSRDVHGNVEIIYTDKERKTADSAIIELISAKKDKKILLVTADEEIISSVQNRIFALIDPIDFYMFVFE
jgi:hypothetical protein